MNGQEEDLKSKTLAGMMWSFMETIGTQAIQLLVQIFLARLLLPKDFGIVGIILVFIAISNVFIDSGFTNGLIREKETTQEDYSTVFFFNLMMSLLLYSVLFFSAGLISTFFSEPKLQSIIRVVGILLIINSFGLIQSTMLTKAINFKVQSKINVSSSLISGLVAIICALLGLGVWSLVIKMLLMQTLQVCLLAYVNRWKPSLIFSRESFKRLFLFGWKIMFSEILSTLYENLYFFIIGASFSATTLGYFTNARRFSETATASITAAIHKVSFPVLSSVRLDKERLKRGYQATIKTSAYIIFPAMIGLVAVAPVLFEVILGPNWIPAIPYFQILCIGGTFYPLIAINSNALQVQGRSDLFLYLNIVTKCLGVVFVGCVIFLNLGIYGLLWFSVIDGLVSYIIFARYTNILVGYSLWEQVKDVLQSLVMSIVMATLVYGQYLLYTEKTFGLLVVQLVTGVILYMVMSIAFKSDELQLILEIGYPLIKNWTSHHQFFKRKSKKLL